MRYRAILLTLLVTCLVSCLSTPPPLKALPAQPGTLTLDDFSISAPDEEGWYLAHEDPNEIQLVRKGTSGDETYAIQAWSIRLPQFFNDEAFVSFIMDRITHNTDETRFIAKKHQALIVNTRHGTCVKFMSVHETLSARKRSGNPGPILLEVVGITCRNPYQPTDGAHLVYSNRHRPGNKDFMLASRAQSLFDSLDFIH
ncbi:hypothetical protein DFR30_0208 [Thiogranum longum]|uniref:Uncharacterized protein n=1 Tax=Thiogranum longum TaxID=1537524 RepID=A0A4R1H737_9GAMM|nr:hypothetical protein [Thiogranum longum]TCK16988.1 hypothetical protein DFR30_0208 [Thiogranum longum]